MTRTQRNRLSKHSNRGALAKRQDAIVAAQPKIRRHMRELHPYCDIDAMRRLQRAAELATSPNFETWLPLHDSIEVLTRGMQ